MTSRRSPTDLSHEMERYFKYLYYKTTQVVVQSRQGEKMLVKSSAIPITKTWFCIGISDINEISHEARKVIQPFLTSGQGILVTPLCIEISLKTAEGDSMVLEIWSISLKDYTESSNNNNNCNSSNTIYNDMGMLLKSLLCVSRALPAYRLSRRQGPDSFVLCYRPYSGQPMSSALGERFQTCPIGAVTTPSGILNVRVDFRPESSMTFDPSTQSGQSHQHQHYSSSSLGGVSSNPGTPSSLARTEPCEMPQQGRQYRPRSDTLGSNKISDDSEPNITTSDESSEMRIFAVSPPDNANAPIHHMRPRKYSNEEERSNSYLESKVKFGAFSTRSIMSKTNSELQQQQQTLPSKERNNSDDLLDLFDVKEDDESRDKDSLEDTMRDISLNQQTNNNQGAFELTNSQELAAKLASESKSNDNKKVFEGTDFDRRGSKMKPEDFEFLDLKTPFAKRTVEANSGDLGVFFKEASTAGPPSLQMFEQNEPRQEEQNQQMVVARPFSYGLQSQLQNLNEELSNFETNLAEYDEMLKTLETVSESESDAV